MRELSIRLFQEAMGFVVGSKKKMKQEVCKSLLLLVFYLHDQDECVAKVGIPNTLISPLGRAMLAPPGWA